MSCDNKVSYHVPSGYDYREVQVKCGNTSPDGSRATCDTCYSDPRTRAAIEAHEENVAADNAWLHSAGWGEM